MRLNCQGIKGKMRHIILLFFTASLASHLENPTELSRGEDLSSFLSICKTVDEELFPAVLDECCNDAGFRQWDSESQDWPYLAFSAIANSVGKLEAFISRCCFGDHQVQMLNAQETISIEDLFPASDHLSIDDLKRKYFIQLIRKRKPRNLQIFGTSLHHLNLERDSFILFCSALDD